MNKLLNYLKVLGIYFGVLIIYVLFISIFYYYEVFNFNTINIISYIFIILLHMFIGIKISKYERKKGYLNGFLIGLSIILIYTIINLVNDNINFSYLIYTLILITSSMIGGIIGVSSK